MKRLRLLLTIIIITFLNIGSICQKQKGFAIYNKDVKVQIVNVSMSHPLYLQLAYMLAHDIKKVCGYSPDVLNDIDDVSRTAIIIGNVDDFYKLCSLDDIKKIHSTISGSWERYATIRIDNFNKNIQNAFCIMGSDHRGTAYGVFSISEQMGISPWYWWADVKPQTYKEVYIDGSAFVSESPSVKYRGIFLNDEDWGLQPWSAKTLEPEIGDIGPKTYDKIFELLLRLKANSIWPAMHNCTNAFFKNSGNVDIAKRYGIVIGSSHAEPMLRNNVGEWDKTEMGDFNYDTNKDVVKNYWKTRVKQSKGLDAIYTVGMRGIHDSGMEGYNSTESKAIALEEIIKDQREMLRDHINPDVTAVPQAFIPYKEVLEIYDHGLNLFEDITIIWPDDNYGYIRRLSDPEEQKHIGGGGVYYHASYWGRPHDYLWLSTTNPSLIWEEMWKAYAANCKNMWILNVGDIKPCEFNMNFFLDMAYDMGKFQLEGAAQNYLIEWYEKVFPALGKEISKMMTMYYQLAFERKPEFSGWSQVEPTIKTAFSEYNHFCYNDEVQRRLADYYLLIEQVDQLKQEIVKRQFEAFFELIEYPVKCAAWINMKFLYLERAEVYAGQGRVSANYYAKQAGTVYDSIVNYTNFYNKTLSNGKWENMMDFAPRDLPVFQKPEISQWQYEDNSGIGLSVEGCSEPENMKNWSLPDFYTGNHDSSFIDVFLTGTKENFWELKSSDNWIVPSKTSGKLSESGFNSEDRIWVHIDESKITNNEQEGKIILKSPGGRYKIKVKVENTRNNGDSTKCIEMNGFVSIWAENFSAKSKTGWQIINDLGYTGKVLAWDKSLMQTWDRVKNDVWVKYEYTSTSENNCEMYLYSLPVHPINSNYYLQVVVSVDGEKDQVVDFKTIGRSEQWKQNVLRNTYKQKIGFGELKPGNHTILIRPIDPGIVLDRIEIDFGGMKSGYFAVPETRVGK